MANKNVDKNIILTNLDTLSDVLRKNFVAFAGDPQTISADQQAFARAAIDASQVSVSASGSASASEVNYIKVNNIEYKLAGGGSAGVQSDWNQNDSTQLDYIKNRTHYSHIELLNSDYYLSTDEVAQYIGQLSRESGTEIANWYVNKIHDALTEKQMSAGFYLSFSNQQEDFANWKDMHQVDSSVQEGLIYISDLNYIWVMNITGTITSRINASIGDMNIILDPTLEPGLYITTHAKFDPQSKNKDIYTYFVDGLIIPSQKLFQQNDKFILADPVEEGSVGLKFTIGSGESAQHKYMRMEKIFDTLNWESIKGKTCSANIMLVNKTKSNVDFRRNTCYGSLTWQDVTSIFTEKAAELQNKIWVLGENSSSGIFQYFAAYYIPENISGPLDFGKIEIEGNEIYLTTEYAISAGLYLQAKGTTTYDSIDVYTAQLRIPGYTDIATKHTVYDTLDRAYISDIVNITDIIPVNYTEGNEATLDKTRAEILAPILAGKCPPVIQVTDLLLEQILPSFNGVLAKVVTLNLMSYSASESSPDLYFGATIGDGMSNTYFICLTINRNGSFINAKLLLDTDLASYIFTPIINSKQDKLTAGNGITITNTTISTTYDEVELGSGLTVSGSTITVDFNTVQEKLTKGSGISISNKVISTNLYRHVVHIYDNSSTIDIYLNLYTPTSDSITSATSLKNRISTSNAVCSGDVANESERCPVTIFKIADDSNFQVTYYSYVSGTGITKQTKTVAFTEVNISDWSMPM